MTVAAGFLPHLVGQLRATDSYGRLDGVADERLLGPYLIMSVPDGIVLPCVVNPAAAGRVRAFFRAVAAGVERATALATDSAVDIDAEGFGRAVVFVGRLVVVCETLRDLNAFGFRSLQRLDEHGAGLVDAAARTVSAHPEVARARP